MKNPGITKGDIEVFALGPRTIVIKDHEIKDMVDSCDTLTIYREKLEADTRVLHRIEQRTSNPIQQIIEYARCLNGDLDKRADISADGIWIPEYWECGRRGICEDEGIVCKTPGNLTKREMDIVRLIAQDLANKQIADHLGISIETVAKHIYNIEDKIQAASKCGIVKFAFENNIYGTRKNEE